jgi:hypothetical protein
MVNSCAVCGCCTRTDIVREHLEDTLRICDVSAKGLYHRYGNCSSLLIIINFNVKILIYIYFHNALDGSIENSETNYMLKHFQPAFHQNWLKEQGMYAVEHGKKLIKFRWLAFHAAGRIKIFMLMLYLNMISTPF